MQQGGNSRQPVLIITGMHRSGTSLTASLLQSAGVDVGKNLLGENYSNPKGHFENLDFFYFHKSVLTSIGVSDDGWTLQKATHVPECFLDEAKLLVQKNASLTQPWGWKDPRTTLFLDFWNTFIPEAKFIFVYRSPWEVIDSLYRRGNEIFHNNPQLALDLWVSYNQIILDFYSRFPDKCFLMHLNQITKNPTAFIESISQRFSISLPPPKEDIYDAHSLKTQAPHSQRAMLIQRYFPAVDRLYQQLNSAANFSEDSLANNQELFSPTAWLLKDWRDVRGLDNQVATLQKELASAQVELASTQVELTNTDRERQQLQAANQILQDANQSLQEELSACVESRNQLKDQLQLELEHAYAAIAAMQTSKFWQLRTYWIQLKQRFQFKD